MLIDLHCHTRPLSACSALTLDAVIADGRVLHAAWANRSNQQRPLVLAWWRVFPFPSVPTWWTGEVPAEIHLAADENYERTRRPGKYLK